jgi:formylglycine-generating enzyme required for sulfatase activity
VVAAPFLVLSASVSSRDVAAGGGHILVNSVGMRMVLVPAGSFQMGSPPGEAFRQEEERPHRVTLTRPFRISATEVTQRQWRALMPHDRSPVRGEDLPVTSVSWRDARAFCAKLSEKEEANYRLPTEAEWEHACRAGGIEPGTATGEAPMGELDAVAWFADNSEGAPHPVGGKRPNAWGLLDMLGNVAEWTREVYAPYPDIEDDEDPAGPEMGSTKVVRGGAFRSFPPALRCAARTGTPESYQLPHLGFRVVRELDPASGPGRER